MSEKQSKLTKKQENFCAAYVLTANAAEAARIAGYPRLRREITAIRLMSDSKIKKRISQLSAQQKKDAAKDAAIKALLRAATCPVSDAVRLLATDDEELKTAAEETDLFCISEIKRQKGGTEIKFIDRIKALEAVCRLIGDADGSVGAAELIKAVTESANGDGGDED